MQFTFGRYIRLMRFFRRIKQTYAYRFVIDFYLSQPFTVFFSDSEKTALVTWPWLPRVLGVFHVGDLAQVNPSIVGSVAVYVIHLFLRPVSGLIKPRQSVRKIQDVVQTYNNVAVFSHASGLASEAASSAGLSPSKNTRVRAVAHKFFEAFWSHAVNINPVMCGGQA